MVNGAQQEVIKTSWPSPGVLQVVMEDRASKNTFSDALTHGLFSVFEQVKRDESCKVVVLTGYDTYFVSGGTQDALLAIHDGRAKFTDVNLYGLALECPVPVISAMQGHGIGGGFVFGMFADLVVLSRESIYTANFMKYGFTPGMGGTLVLPYKLGFALAEEMLLTAGTYRGAELERRGVPFAVLPRAEVLPRALELAQDLADKPRVSLVTLKSHLVRALREQLGPMVEREVEMHGQTFHQPEVRERIDRLFGR